MFLYQALSIFYPISWTKYQYFFKFAAKAEFLYGVKDYRFSAYIDILLSLIHI